MRLADKLAAITAAASGMGAAAARLFAKEGAGVAVIDLNRDGAEAVAGEITAAGGRAVAIQA
ncbi:MAG: SDR family NAD(P)-dependent oxidoreductase, partial [Kiloniellales bacterium]